MKNRFWLCAGLSILLMGVSSAARAASDSPSTGPTAKDSLYVALASAKPSSPSAFQDYYTVGGGLGLGYGFALSRSFQLVAEADFNTFPVDTSKYKSSSGGSYKDVMFLVNGRLRFIPRDNPVVPYGILGVGLSVLNQDALTATLQSGGTLSTASHSFTSFAGRLGLGIDVRLSDPTSLFFELDGAANDQIGYGQFRIGGRFNL